MFAPASVRMRKIRNGTSGFATRSSVTTKAASSAALTASRPIVRTVAQPTCGAFEIAYTNTASPPVTVRAPSGS